MFKIAVIVDAQYDFMDPNGALFVPGADQVTPILDQYLASLSLEQGYIGALFTADTHDTDTYPDSAEAKGDPDNGIPGFPPHCIRGTDGWNFAVNIGLVPEGTPKFILNKGVFSMWKEPDLVVRPLRATGEIVAVGGEKTRERFFFDILSSGINEVEVVGVASDYCVNWAISGLVSPRWIIHDEPTGFNVTTYDNLTAGIERDIHQVVAENYADMPVRVL